MLAVWAKRHAPLLSTCAKPTLVGLPLSLGAPPVAAALLAGAAALPLGDDDALLGADEELALPLVVVLLPVEGVPHAASTSMTIRMSEANKLGRFTTVLLCMWMIGLKKLAHCWFFLRCRKQFGGRPNRAYGGGSIDERYFSRLH